MSLEESTEDLTFEMPQGDALNLDESTEDLTVELTQSDALSLEESPLFQTEASESLEGAPKYTLLTQLGIGAMGEVHLAQENFLMRKVALKQLKKDMAVNSLVLNRFLNEVQITAQLDHPNIVPIYNLENSPAGLAYTMKVVKGHTLKELIQADALRLQSAPLASERQALAIRLEHFLNVCDALAFAHKKGVIHRDLKPANIMIGSYQDVYVMDWGIARLMGGEREPQADQLELANILADDDMAQADLTQVGQILGTPRYMSPQQAAGKNNELDGRSDQFSLGLILFELVALKTAFTAKNQTQLLMRVLKADKNPLVHVNPKVPIAPELKAIIHKATARKPDDRYANLSEMAEDLRRYQRGEAVQAKPDTPWQKTLRWLGHHQQKVWLAVMFTVLISAGVSIYSMWVSQQDLIQARAREQKYNQFLKLVFEQSHRIDHHFMRTQVALEGLASAVTAQLLHGLPGQEPYYVHARNFKPPDLAYSRQYNGPTSISWPISVIGHVHTPDVADKLKQMIPLRHYMKRMILENYTGGLPVPDLKEQWRLIAEKGLPINSGVIVLKEGAAQWLPGSDFEAHHYNPLKRPFYLLSAYKHGINWGNPYIDVSGAGLLLNCGTALYDHQQQFLGTVSLDIKFDFIIETLLQLRHKALRGSYLLNEKGQIAIQSTQKGQQFTAEIHPDLKLPLYPNPAVVKAVLARQSGQIEARQGGKTQLEVYQRINTLGWYYVVVADVAQL